MTADQIAEASKIWISGGTYKDICPLLGVSKRTFYGLCEQRRDLFPARTKLITDEVIQQASEMWLAGASIEQISLKLGIEKRRIAEIARNNEDGRFPYRWRGKNGFLFGPKPEEKRADVRPIPVLRDDCMRWITTGGAVVTLPKISLIQCPRAAA